MGQKTKQQSLGNRKMPLNKWSFTVIVSFIIFLFKGPFALLIPAAGLDPSWQLALRWATLSGFSFGDDVVFTYGPLYFISRGLANIGPSSSLIIGEIIYALVHYIVAFLVVYQFSNTIYSQSWKNNSSLNKFILIAGLLLYALIPTRLPEVVLVLSALFFVKLIFSENQSGNSRKIGSLLLLSTGSLALVSVMKFSYVMASVSIMLLAIIAMVYKKKYHFIVYTLLSFTGIHLLLWLVSGQPLSALMPYYRYGFEISSGYTEAMMQNMPATQFMEILALIISTVVLILSFYFLVRKKSFYHAYALFLMLPLLFLAFKNGFVRADLWHSLDFYSQLVPVLLYFIFLLPGDKIFFDKRLLPSFILLTGIVTSILYVTQFASLKEIASDSTKQLFSRTVRSVQLEQQKLQQSYPPLSSTFVEKAKNGTVDVFPWDISLLYAYDLKWLPRPVIQSYTAYTSLLDRLNARHFESGKAPDYIVYTYGGIDGRYPLFDEPEVFRTIQANYELMEPENYIYLQRRQEKIDYEYTPVKELTTSIGTVVDVPQLPGHHVYCNIEISMNLYGKLMNLLYKTEPIYIALYVKGQPQPLIHRFIRRTGVDGLFVSKYAGNLYDIYQIFAEQYEQNIEKIQLLIKGEDTFYKPEINYAFYTTPFNTANENE